MNKQNRYADMFSNANWVGLWFACSRPFIEIFHGITSKSINWFVCLIPGLVLNLLVVIPKKITSQPTYQEPEISQQSTPLRVPLKHLIKEYSL